VAPQVFQWQKNKSPCFKIILYYVKRRDYLNIQRFIKKFLYNYSSSRVLLCMKTILWSTEWLPTVYLWNVSNMCPHCVLYSKLLFFNSQPLNPLGKNRHLWGKKNSPLLIKNWTVQTWPALAAFIKGVLPPSDSCSCGKKKRFNWYNW
jgi:hypothetical protein